MSLKIRFPFPVMWIDEFTVELADSIDRPLVTLDVAEEVKAKIPPEIIDKAYRDVVKTLVHHSIAVGDDQDNVQKLIDIARYFLRSTDPSEYDGTMRNLVNALDHSS